ncbi:hypothetical protein T265_01559 [Opisthorchis viverrini]|uniref:Reverse transcriptase RNase H-like domain-containing protein n=1 Tax=Opisthorchis viverrini TaxID=6198 RepID=A0A074ZZ23_OPIVI|nr:hypothetical protein T265_01559 [Opisthorchis viverrini]KER32331.1 hypothetical protein T265_01559 [Opisthorchis viverrini]
MRTQSTSFASGELALENTARRTVYIILLDIHRKIAAISAPPHKLAHKDRKFSQTVGCDEVFNHLKKAPAPILKYPDLSDAEEFVLNTDINLSLTTVTQREMLALVYFFQHFQPYLLGWHFLVSTEHHLLQCLQSYHDPYCQVSRW